MKHAERSRSHQFLNGNLPLTQAAFGALSTILDNKAGESVHGGPRSF